jgi:hypothetical protein
MTSAILNRWPLFDWVDGAAAFVQAVAAQPESPKAELWVDSAHNQRGLLPGARFPQIGTEINSLRCVCLDHHERIHSDWKSCLLILFLGREVRIYENEFNRIRIK